MHRFFGVIVMTAPVALQSMLTIHQQVVMLFKVLRRVIVIEPLRPAI